jgi:hypothetical protein
VGEQGAQVPLVRRTVPQLAAAAHARDGAAFDPATSPWFKRAIFVTGAPRSGTSWLHQMLMTHPDVATAGEMHAFCEGLDAVFANFDSTDPYMNLSTWVTRSELVTLARAFVDGLLTGATRIEEAGATRVLDKTPNHAHTAGRLAEVYPDATFIQIIRNPRDALSSARDLWRDWNPRLHDWSAIAADWRATVEDCRTHLSPLRYHEVRYEDLLNDPMTQFPAILEAAGLRYDDEYVANAVEFGKAPVNVRPSDQRISAAKWADIDPDAERQIVEVAGELMVELGYLTDDGRHAILARQSARRAAAAVRREGSRTLRGAQQRVTRTATRASDRLRNHQHPGAVMATTRTLVAAAKDGDAATVQTLLSAKAKIVYADQTTTQGAAAVARELCESLTGAEVIPVVADRLAAAVEVVQPGAPRMHQRYYVTRGVVTLVVIEGNKR